MSSRPAPLKLAHSPDADDAFMFYALAGGKVDTEGLEFEHVLQDIQTLNQWAVEGRLEITALSVFAYGFVSDRYALLTHGASMGDGYGPVLVAREPMTVDEAKLRRIAVAGHLTSSYLALRLALGDVETVVVPFDRIMDAVSAGEVDLGLLIHEGQLTHRERGLAPVLDLGVWWHERTGLPLPLGVNAVRRDLGNETMARVSRVLRASIDHGLEHRAAALDYALKFGRGIDRGVADKFVGMYVNDLTRDMGERGRAGIERMLDEAHRAGLLQSRPAVTFVED